MKTSDFLPFH